MKRIIRVCVLISLCLILLTGCCFPHDWAAANCTTPQTCTQCGKTKGAALGHNFVDDNCTTCNLTEEEIFIIGEWVGSWVTIEDGNILPPGTYHAEDFRCTFNGDGTCELNFASITHNGQWSTEYKGLDMSDLLSVKYAFNVSSPTAQHLYGFQSAENLSSSEDLLLTTPDIGGVLFEKIEH